LSLLVPDPLVNMAVWDAEAVGDGPDAVGLEVLVGGPLLLEHLSLIIGL